MCKTTWHSLSLHPFLPFVREWEDSAVVSYTECKSDLTDSQRIAKSQLSTNVERGSLQITNFGIF